MRVQEFKSKTPRFDDRVITRKAYNQVLEFVNNKVLYGTARLSRERVLQRLKGIGYIPEKHNKYTFMYEISSYKDFGPDIRHIYIKELNAWFSYL